MEKTKSNKNRQTFKEEQIKFLKKLPEEELYYYATCWLTHTAIIQQTNKLWHDSEEEDAEKEVEEEITT